MQFTDEQREVMKRAIKTWGETQQINKAIEEMADVTIMMEQLNYIFHAYGKLPAAVETKIQKLKGYLDT